VQQVVAAAVGLEGTSPFAAMFAAFLTRAYDFIRMSAMSNANMGLCGSHGGLEIGADGPSQMGLEDLAMMRAVQGSAVLYPSDATSAAALVRQIAERAQHRLHAHDPRRVPDALWGGGILLDRRGQGLSIQPG
jgi:transketolase